MQTTVTYTEALIRKATFRFWVRFINWHGFSGKHVFFTLPINAISNEDRELMCAKIRENGGRVL